MASRNPESNPAELKNLLIKRAIDDDNELALRKLMEQLGAKPAFNVENLDWFRKSWRKPMLLQILLDHYSLNDVVKAALVREEWTLIVSLLHGKTTSELDHSLIQKISLAASSILDALENCAKEQLLEDPRHKLNEVLINSHEVLSVVLAERKNEIRALITSIQNLMSAAGVDLNRTFYRFDMQDQLQAELQALKEITPKIQLFLANNRDKTNEEIIANEPLRQELKDIKKFLSLHHLSAQAFVESDRLLDLFNVYENLVQT